MKILKHLLFVLAAISSHQLYSQTCIDYGEFDDPACTPCAPTNWTGVQGTEDISDPNTSPPPGCTTNITPSPSGGTVVHLDVAPMALNEAIETTVSGLTPGVEYTLLFWWLSVDVECISGNICCAELIVTVDGVSYSYGDAPGWSLIEICITPGTSSIDIELAGIDNGSNQGAVLIDDADCADATGTCCSLIAIANPAEEVCPNNDVILSGEYDFETGTVTVEWTSDPPEGVDYLDDPFIENPTFNYSNTDPEFEGVTFTFTFTVEDDNCISQQEMTVDVLALAQLSFEFEDNEYCEDYGHFDFPTTSLEGVNGSWNIPSINTNQYAGESVTVAFTADPGELLCPVTSEHTITIAELSYPEFDFPLLFCRETIDSYQFPETALNGIIGSWNIDVLVLEQWPDGIIEIYFTPDDPFCIEETVFEVEIISGQLLTFDLPTSACSSSDVIIFPDASLEGIEGDWDYSEIIPSEHNGVILNLFTPDSDGCYASYLHELEILNFIEPSFDLADTICTNYGEFIFSDSSNEGYDGDWSISSFNTNTINTDMVVSIWTPEPDQEDCLIEATHTVHITEPTLPVFDIPLTMCLEDTIFNFPDTSLIFSFPGAWTFPTLDPASTGPGEFVNTFTPISSECADSLTVTINILDSALPSFSFSTAFCETDDIFQLPTVDDNGIEGIWSNPEINPSNFLNGELSSLFTPLNDGLCYSQLEVQFTSESPIAPAFDLPGYHCWNDTILLLPSQSDNDLSGVWNIGQIDPNLSQGDTISLYFTPDLDCVESYVHEIIIVPSPNITYTLVNPTGCTTEDGQIILGGDTSDNEYSIDNGTNWISSDIIDALPSGSYQLLIRNKSFDLCLESIDFSLYNADAPDIDDIEISHVSSCLVDNGSATILSQGTDLEYSIDGGTNWQSSHIFIDLSSGDYIVLIRSVSNPDCVSETMFSIEAFPETTIIDITAKALSDCESNDGSIYILAQGQNLEYSIDDGISWQYSGSFINLSEGVYEIIVRSIDDTDCLERQSITLLAPELPTITSIDISHPGNCHPDAGIISIIANGNDLEYSIDNGLTWQTYNTFVNLSQGTYEVVVRERSQPNCTDTDRAVLVEESELLMDVQLETIGPSACMTDDAQIIINSVETDIELSYDQGITWQRDLIIDNLVSGQYTIIVRHVQYVNCLITLEALIEDVDCPCADLNINANVTPMYCVDQTNGSIEITNVLGQMNDDYDIIWDTGEMGDMLNNLSGGWYPFTLLYDDGCMWRDSVFVEQIDPLNFNLTTYDPNCPGAADGAIEITEISGGNGNFTYSLDGIDYQTSNVFVDLSPSEYQVFVLDDQQCLQSQFVELLSHDPIEIDFPQILPIEQGETVYLNPLIDQMSIDSFEWEPHPSIINPGQLIAEVTPHETTSYTLSIFYGLCIEVRIITVEVLESEDLYIANIISLDSQDGNNRFYIQSADDTGITINNLSIYDRWGNLMFTKDNPEINNPDDGWNGYYNNYKVQSGVYVYMLEYSLAGETKKEAGTITVVY